MRALGGRPALEQLVREFLAKDSLVVRREIKGLGKIGRRAAIGQRACARRRVRARGLAIGGLRGPIAASDGHHHRVAERVGQDRGSGRSTTRRGFPVPGATDGTARGQPNSARRRKARRRCRGGSGLTHESRAAQREVFRGGLGADDQPFAREGRDQSDLALDRRTGSPQHDLHPRGQLFDHRGQGFGADRWRAASRPR